MLVHLSLGCRLSKRNRHLQEKEGKQHWWCRSFQMLFSNKILQHYSSFRAKKKPRHSQILGLAELGVRCQFSISFHSLLFLLRTGSSRQMLQCLWQMDTPTCYTKHLWMQVLFGTAGEFSLGLRSHYLSVRWKHDLEDKHQGDLPPHTQFRAQAPFMPVPILWGIHTTREFQWIFKDKHADCLENFLCF